MDYFRDNPFRLLGMDSSASPAALRSAAKAVSAARRVGIAKPVPYSDVFGAESLDRVDQIVKQCAVDAELRACFSYAWLRAQPAQALSSPDPSAPKEVTEHDTFFSSWIAFLRNGTPAALARALANWQLQYVDDSVDERLTKLIASEENIAIEEAADVVYDAQEKVGKQVLEVAASRVLQKIAIGETSQGIDLLRAVLDSPMDDHWEEVALKPIADHFRRIVREITQEQVVWHSGWVDEDRAAAKEVLTFSVLMGQRYPGASHWMAEVHTHYDGIAMQIRNWAVSQHNQHGRTAVAADAIERALEMPVSLAARSALDKDRVTLRSMLANKAADDIEFDFKKGFRDWLIFIVIIFAVVLAYTSYKGEDDPWLQALGVAGLAVAWSLIVWGWHWIKQRI